MELATHIAIKELEGKVESELLEEYSEPGNGKYQTMVDQIRKRLGLTTLRYQKLSDLVSAIGLPKEKLCTHCWDGSSHF
jgi:amidophosphoribosyltransferase